MGYDLVSFDLDGTLVDTASEIVEAANRALESHGMARRPAGEITLLIGAGAHALMLRLLAQLFVEQPALADRVRPEQVLASFDAHYAATTGTTAVLYDGTRLALEALRGEGVRLACVTNKELRHTWRVLQVFGLDGFFDAVIGGDSLPHKKPHASVLRHVVERLGGEARRTAHVGDSATDVEAARNAGVSAWAVPYGYNAGQPIEAARPERIFGDLRQLAEHVIDTRRARAGGC
jgi:phosphoglycolate phosphatase